MAPPTVERARLIAEVLAFVRAAQRLPGITRIALIGSIPTNKADPKDIVWVTHLVTGSVTGHRSRASEQGEPY